MFFTNLKEIINNFPLILSDSTNPKDVSLHRVCIIILMGVVTFSPPLTLHFFPTYLEKLTPYYNQILVLLGGLITSNLVKTSVKVISGSGGEK